jgi:hypothetical protein
MAGARKANPITSKNSDTLPIENSIDFELFKLLQDLVNWIYLFMEIFYCKLRNLSLILLFLSLLSSPTKRAITNEEKFHLTLLKTRKNPQFL